MSIVAVVSWWRRRAIPFSVSAVFPATLAVAAGAQDGWAGPVIRGHARDAGGAPIVHADIAITNGNFHTAAGDSGEFFLPLRKSGTYQLLVRRLGYAPITLTVPVGDSVTTVDVQLTPATAGLSATVTTAKQVDINLNRSGFYDRLIERNRGAGAGTSITPEEIEAWHVSDIASFFYGISNINLMRLDHGSTITGPNGCIMTIYIDKQRVYPTLGDVPSQLLPMASPYHVGASGSTPKPIEEFIDVSDVAGIEVYPRTVSAPSQFQLLNGTCGVVVFWTK